ncbi:peptidoglycan recognition protein family protein [Nocardiopsis ansamitocini]|uniref:N-acetylmuramoyl-L-alanine amidase n=1 Tax=Nocardiopsis ansamitocini TaxID=1670832 RepID=A0A9W6P4M7_9ACTN|nr:peptidoglycan recognition family protein [Nocardiopsis ansamitocini]GLU47022.1 hypothetical protein Nans01_13730 [Nocardiopsis ansamitocini]
MATHEQRPVKAGLSRRNVFRGAAVAAGGVLLGGAVDLGGAPVVLAAGTPVIYARADWKARKATQSSQVVSTMPDHIVVHHTATANATNYSKEHAFSLSRGIQNHHMNSNGWNDTGQQLTISRGGHIMEGRNRSIDAIVQRRHVIGAHVANHNSHTVGIENEGTYTSATPPGALMDSLVETCAWLCVVYRLDPKRAIVGHRDFNATSCPGDKLYSMLPKLRTDVAALLDRLKTTLPQAGTEQVPDANCPDFPDVPQNERAMEFYHGPTVGSRDTAG